MRPAGAVSKKLVGERKNPKAARLCVSKCKPHAYHGVPDMLSDNVCLDRTKYPHIERMHNHNHYLHPYPHLMWGGSRASLACF
jgi:hypothetical protein